MTRAGTVLGRDGAATRPQPSTGGVRASKSDWNRVGYAVRARIAEGVAVRWILNRRVRLHPNRHHRLSESDG